LCSAASRLKFIFYFEVTIGRFFTLFFNILHDHFVSDIPRTRYKVSPSPHVATPKGSAQTLVLHHHFTRSLPLNRLNQLTNRHVRRNRDKKMNMVPRYIALYYLNILGFANFSDQVPNPQCYITTEYWLAVFGYPDYVIFDIVYGMAGFAVVLHTASILKSSPKGEGFSPNPRMGQ